MKKPFGAIRQLVFAGMIGATLAWIPAQAASAQQKDEFGKITRVESMISKALSLLMREQHLSGKAIDDSISRRAFDMYLKTLDPMKLYFLQSDVDEFSKWRDDIDNQMVDGKYDAALAIFNRLLKRIDERVDLALELVDSEFDYTRDEELVTDRDLMQWPKDQKEARELWRKRIKYNLLVLTVDQQEDEEEKAEKAKEGDGDAEVKNKKPPTDPRETLRKRYQSFAKRMRQTDTQDVVEMYMSAITTSFDPHTSYMSKETFENFLISLRLSLEGIGATLQATDDGYTVIKRIVPGGAADKQGELKVEDKIVAVGQGEDGEMVDVTGMKLDDVVKKIRGKAGTKVHLSVMSENSSELRDIIIVREKIKLEDSAAKGAIFDSGKKDDGSEYKIGVIDLPSFYSDMGSGVRTAESRSTTKDVKKILDDFNAKDVDAVVLDLRRNGGGSLREAIDCTGLFIDTGAVVQVKDSYGQVQYHNDEKVGMAWDKPLVVLTSKFSASASEILAGAVQDYRRGIVIGDTTTHGKGTVQNLMDLDAVIMRQAVKQRVFGALKITMQQFYRPNGDSTQKRGVLSDVVLPSISDKMDVSESDLDYPVEFDKISPAPYEPYSMVDNETLDRLRKSSAKRIAESERFKREIHNIEQYVEQKNRKAVTLNKEKFIARRKEFSAEKQDEKTIEDQVNHASTDIKRDYYLDEVLSITTDYLNSLKGDKKVAKR